MKTVYDELKEIMKDAYETEVLPEKVVNAICLRNRVFLDIEKSLKLAKETPFKDVIELIFYTKDFLFEIDFNDYNEKYIVYKKISHDKEEEFVPEDLITLYYAPEFKKYVPFKTDGFYEKEKIEKENRKKRKIETIRDRKEGLERLYNNLTEIENIPEDFEVFNIEDNTYIKIPTNFDFGEDGYTLPRKFGFSTKVIDFIGFARKGFYYESNKFGLFSRVTSYDSILNQDIDPEVNKVHQEFKNFAKESLREAIDSNKLFKVIGFQDEYWKYDKSLRKKTKQEVLEQIISEFKKKIVENRKKEK